MSEQLSKRGRPKGSKNKVRDPNDTKSLLFTPGKKRGRKAMRKSKYSKYDGSQMEGHSIGVRLEDDGSISTANSQSSTSSTDGHSSEDSSQDNKKSLNPKFRKRKIYESQEEVQKAIQRKANVILNDKATKEYQACIVKAMKCLNYSREMKSVTKDQIKYYVNKAISYYRKGFDHSTTDQLKAKLHVLIAECHMELCPKQYEHDLKGKQIAKACESLKNALAISTDFDDQVTDDYEPKIKSLIQKQLIEKIDDGELLCTLFEMIFQQLNKRMPKLLDFVGSELYQSYFRIACEISDLKGDLENAMRYLKQCKVISKTIGIKDNAIIDMKLQEIKKVKKRKCNEKSAIEAKNNIHLGDVYASNNQIDEALIQYRQALKMAKDCNDIETEALCNFRIGKTLFSIDQQLDKARNHLVDFQIQCQMGKEKGDNLSKKYKEANYMLGLINDILQKRKSPKQKLSRYEELLQREKYQSKDSQRNPSSKRDSKQKAADGKSVNPQQKERKMKIDYQKIYQEYIQNKNSGTSLNRGENGKGQDKEEYIAIYSSISSRQAELN
ncbi:UNKNOWN [Stylonychia lemnae]|uniref:Uncharacterized protein n=1 Tax=Stylonychia lemnae TaxID=5949 RepID=A0A077ZSW5_STYLE|nr:UNKNOWN [Stylonychia lemnae]|eukprot:CDW72644.1 UNKNOWN [Stylonychia lemnae]